MIKNIFDPNVSREVIERINNLTANTEQKWGKMNVDQMLAHCNVTYEMIFDESTHKRPTGFKSWMLRKFVKPIVCGHKIYKPNGRTAPEFIKADTYKFEEEKVRLIDYINKTSNLTGKHFEGKESHSFGTLTEEEWNNMFYKHLDHHLNQFGV